MIPCSCARDVQQVTLGIIYLSQICLVSHRFDALLQGDDFIIAGHDDDGAELQPLGEMHGADRDVTAGGRDVFIENLERESEELHSRPCTVQFCGGSHEDTKLVGRDTIL